MHDYNFGTAQNFSLTDISWYTPIAENYTATYPTGKRIDQAEKDAWIAKGTRTWEEDPREAGTGVGEDMLDDDGAGRGWKSKGKARGQFRGLGTQGLMDLGRGLCNLYRRSRKDGGN
jgi:hypothetical protein